MRLHALIIMLQETQAMTINNGVQLNFTCKRIEI